MKIRIAFLTLLFAALVPVFAAEAALSAVIVELAGKVEVKAPGLDWKTAKVGAVIKKGTVVSTGFKSTAVIKVGDAMITVKPVTRLNLEELVRTQGGTQTQLFLISGRVKADVTPSTTEKVAFSIKSATATASVRGTGFEFDGYNLLVTHGMVELRNNWGQFRHVGGGEYSFLDPESSVSIPIAVNPSNGLERLDELVAQSTADTEAGDLDSSVSKIKTLTSSLVISLE